MSINRKKIMLICGDSRTVISFRKRLIETLLDLENEVHVIVFDDKFMDYFREIGCKVYVVGSSNRNTNPLSILKLKKSYYNVIKSVLPDVVFTFMLKPNLFGVTAAKKAGVKNIFSMVEGAGDVFINNGITWKIIRKVVCFLYARAFRNCKKVFFLNGDDRENFLNRKIVKLEQCVNVYGVGVDLDKFSHSEIENSNRFLMVARMLKTKGVLEYCECAKLVKQKYPDCIFEYLGDEGTVKIEDIQPYIDEGYIVYYPFDENVLPYLKNCSVFCLPSYREGMPVSVMEAEAVGRMAIVSDTTGCRETVIDGYNGLFSKVKDAKSLADKCIWCIENFNEVIKMGKNARAFAEENFNCDKINKEILEIINV